MLQSRSRRGTIIVIAQAPIDSFQQAQTEDDAEKAFRRTRGCHFEALGPSDFRSQKIHETAEIPEQDIRDIFKDFEKVLGRVGAAKCLHLLAPGFFPLWDAAILKGYGMEKGEYWQAENPERYVAFIRISKVQIDNLGNFGSLTDNPLKGLDEYNYCRFTKNVRFD
jgi:hypothetical protein